jgi:hypothetical protein
VRFPTAILLFAGYTLLYASVAAGGKMATEPWSGLFADAYTGASATSNQASAGIAGAVGGALGNAANSLPSFGGP